MHKLTTVFWGLLFAAVASAKTDINGSPTIGFLEFGVSVKPQARRAFRKRGSEWTICEKDGDCPVQGKWMVIYDHKNLRQLGVSLPPSEVKDVPRIAARVAEFSGWEGIPKARPLLLVNQGHISDPDRWVRAPIRSETEVMVAEAYRKQFPKITNCGANGEAHEISAQKAAEMKFTILSAFWSRRSGAVLVSFKPKGHACTGPGGPEWDSQLFYQKGDEPFRFLGSGLTPIEATDVDGDGHSEWFFWFTGYKTDGYALFFDGMEKSVKLEWSF